MNKQNNFKDIPKIFADRFSEDYLKFLLEQLKEENLLATAIEEPKEIDKYGKKIVYNKCVRIDFCGLASNTLLGTNLGRGSANKTTDSLRKEIAEAFSKIFSRESLKNFNENHNTYLKVRFCFSYMYSDYPVCLMKAENSKNWETMGDGTSYNFDISNPLTKIEFEASKIWNSQRDSLTRIIDFITGNEDLIIMGGKEKQINTIQVRFAVIPSPICMLFVNDISLCDSYLYAKMENETYLSVHYPVCIISKLRDELQFKSIRKHFGYLWQHDLTLYCSDATAFTSEQPRGLATINPPFNDFGAPNINWDHKSKTIMEKILETEFTQDIESWKANLNLKLGLNTRKIFDIAQKPQNDLPNNYTSDLQSVNLRIMLKMNGEKFWLQILNYNKVICEKYTIRASLLFCVLLHYGYAKYIKKDPVMHTNHTYTGQKFYKQIESQLKNNRIGLLEMSDKLLFDSLFQTYPFFDIKLTQEHIFIDLDYKDKFTLTNYSCGQYKEAKGTIDYTIGVTK